MKSSPRHLQLIPKRGVISKKKRYWSLRNAVRHSMILAIETGYPITIYDTERGMDIAVVVKGRADVQVQIIAPRLFAREWSHA